MKYLFILIFIFIGCEGQPNITFKNLNKDQNTIPNEEQSTQKRFLLLTSDHLFRYSEIVEFVDLRDIIPNYIDLDLEYNSFEVIKDELEAYNTHDVYRAVLIHGIECDAKVHYCFAAFIK